MQLSQVCKNYSTKNLHEEEQTNTVKNQVDQIENSSILNVLRKKNIISP